MNMVFFEMIVQGLIESILGKMIIALFLLIRKLGVLGLKILTLSKTSFKELNEKKYKTSSKPYWLGFGILIAIVFITIHLQSS